MLAHSGANPENLGFLPEEAQRKHKPVVMCIVLGSELSRPDHLWQEDLSGLIRLMTGSLAGLLSSKVS